MSIDRYTESQVEDMYNDFLDEIGEQGIENYSWLLQKGDPIAYNCGFDDFTDNYHMCNECGMYTEDDLVNGLCEECLSELEEQENENEQ